MPAVQNTIALAQRKYDEERLAALQGTRVCQEHLVRSDGTCVHCDAQVDVDEDSPEARPCEGCNAEAGEPCRVGCLGLVNQS